ncbi:MAG: hypothetical protein AAF629_04290 [Chloroflexota bacterium]
MTTNPSFRYIRTVKYHITRQQLSISAKIIDWRAFRGAMELKGSGLPFEPKMIFPTIIFGAGLCSFFMSDTNSPSSCLALLFIVPMFIFIFSTLVYPLIDSTKFYPDNMYLLKKRKLNIQVTKKEIVNYERYEPHRITVTKGQQIHIQQEEMNGKNMYKLLVKRKGYVGEETIVSGITSLKVALVVEHLIEKFLDITDNNLDSIVKHVPTKKVLIFAQKHRFKVKSKRYPHHIQAEGVYGNTQASLSAKWAKFHKPAIHIELALPNPRKTDYTAAKPFDRYKWNEVMMDLTKPLDVSLIKRGAADQFLFYTCDEHDESLEHVLDTLIKISELYIDLVAAGGNKGPDLKPFVKDKGYLFRDLIWHALKEIGRQTQYLKPHLNQYLCKDCLTRFTAHQILGLKFKRITYYGCRQCHQSQDYYTAPRVRVILGNTEKQDLIQDADTLNIHWQNQDKVFDFDEVALRSVTDEEIERFVVKINNDTDPLRQQRYNRLICTNQRASPLSPQSWRLLESVFGEVRK